MSNALLAAGAAALVISFGLPATTAMAQPMALAPPASLSSPFDSMERSEPRFDGRRSYGAPVDDRAGMPSHLRRQIVRYDTRHPAGTIVIDTPNTYLYFVLGNGRAVRYGIGVGREGFAFSGVKSVARMAEWPDWTPPAEMIERQPYLPRFMAGGPSNPLGARALYLGDSLYRIHGTNQPESIGSRASSGCIRMLNEDVVDLYERVRIGARVVVMPDRSHERAAPSARSRPGSLSLSAARAASRVN